MTHLQIMPPGFEDLAVLSHFWARGTENERSAIRWASSKSDFEQFYTIFMPRLDAVLEFLKTVPLAEMAETDQNLFYLACAFAEASPHHELYNGSAEVPFSFAAPRFVPGHGNEASEARYLR